MHCIHCQAPLSPGALVCGNCGQAVAQNAPGGSPCPRCQAPLRAGARFCGSCGQSIPAAAPAKGPGTPQPLPSQGARQPAPSPASGPPPIPQGFVLDPGSGLYYTAAPGRDPATGAGGTCYTWFTPATGEYRHSFQPSAPIPQGAPKGAQAPRQSPGKPERRGRKGVPLVFALLALMIGSGLAFWQAGGIGRLRGPASTEIPQGIALVSLDPAALPRFQPVAEEDASLPEESSSPQETQEPEHRPEPGEPGFSAGMGAYLSTDQWYSFPHASSQYMQTEEDFSYVYTIRPQGELLYEGTLLAVDKETGDTGAYRLSSGQIYSFTLMEDFLYFGVLPFPDSRHCAYYRAPKEGGSAEFLFVQEAALISSYHEYLLLLFPIQGALGVYREGDAAPQLLPLLEEDEQETYLTGSFSVCDDRLYYGQTRHTQMVYYRRRLHFSGGEVRQEAREELLASANVGLGMILDPVFTDQRSPCVFYGADEETNLPGLYLSYGEAQATLLADLSEEDMIWPFLARSEQTLYYQLDETLCSIPWKNLTQGEVAHQKLYALPATPCGISREFLFFPNEIRWLHSGEIAQQGEAPVVSEFQLDAYDEAEDWMRQADFGQWEYTG